MYAIPRQRIAECSEKILKELESSGLSSAEAAIACASALNKYAVDGEVFTIRRGVLVSDEERDRT